MGYCEKVNCGYWYVDEDGEGPFCHYTDPWPAPCEIEEEEDYDE